MLSRLFSRFCSGTRGASDPDKKKGEAESRTEYWTLLNVFGLDQFQVTCYLSPNSLLMGNADKLLDSLAPPPESPIHNPKQTLIVSPRLVEQQRGRRLGERGGAYSHSQRTDKGLKPPEQGSVFCEDLFVCRPNKNIHQDILSFLSTPDFPGRWKGAPKYAYISRGTGIRDFINDFFAHQWQEAPMMYGADKWFRFFHPEIAGKPQPKGAFRERVKESVRQGVRSLDAAAAPLTPEDIRKEFVGFEKIVRFVGLRPWALTKRLKVALALCDSMYQPDFHKCEDVLQIRLFEVHNKWLRMLHNHWWEMYHAGINATNDGTVRWTWRANGLKS